jgi:hypothetical protein
MSVFRAEGRSTLIEIEVQNETHQTEHRLRFSAVPRIGEGIRLQEPDGFWASYDVVDLWYQKAEYGDVWVPYLHVRVTPGERAAANDTEPMATLVQQEPVPFTI